MAHIPDKNLSEGYQRRGGWKNDKGLLNLLKHGDEHDWGTDRRCGPGRTAAGMRDYFIANNWTGDKTEFVRELFELLEEVD